MGDRVARDEDEEPGRGRYRVHLDVFEGPFDLLLQLIARRKLDVTEVDLAEITAEFLAFLRLPDDAEGALTGLDLETATHFLVVAATLIELKAARLLPTDEREELEDLLQDARDVLYARLLEYRAFRDVSRILAHLLDANEGYVGRSVALEPRFRDLSPDTRLQIDANGLAALASIALAPRPEARVSVAHIRQALLTVREAAGRLLRGLRQPGDRAEFHEIVRGVSRSEFVVHFLAILELYKLGQIDIEQPQRFGPVQLTRREGGQELTLLDAAEADQPPQADPATA